MSGKVENSEIIRRGGGIGRRRRRRFVAPKPDATLPNLLKMLTKQY
jgi:hypothetical protein